MQDSRNTDAKGRVLVVDDEQPIRDLLSRHFRFLGYGVATAANGRQALSALEGSRFDVVITDINMPVMDGTELLRQIRQHYPMTHCIVITGYVTMDNVLACMRHGALTCVFKPLDDIRELEDAVDKAVVHLRHWQSKLRQLLQMRTTAARSSSWPLIDCRGATESTVPLSSPSPSARLSAARATPGIESSLTTQQNEGHDALQRSATTSTTPNAPKPPESQ